MEYKPPLPRALQDAAKVSVVPSRKSASVQPGIKALFPHIDGETSLAFSIGNKDIKHSPKRIGTVFSGGQAAGGHNVVTGLFDALKKLHPDSRLFGFLDGPKGIIENKHIEITEKMLAPFRNQGGFDLLGSGRTKIETPEQFQAAKKTVQDLQLDGLVIIGGDDSNTNAALLAEYFKTQGCTANVIGVPKTIDGDLQSKEVEISFGFDTACKTYADIIGNIARDCLSAKKSYYFIKLMGRSASHVTLECALQTHPNMTLIGEEIEAQQKTLQQITQEISDMICSRADKGKDYGLILIPEGIIEFIPEFKKLIGELNALLANDKPHAAKVASLGTKEEQADYVSKQLNQEAAACFKSIPKELQAQLLMDRDPHGNVQVSKIETERLFIGTVRSELKKRKESGKYKGSFSPQPHFCGYEGRSCMPSDFDANYCYALGYAAAILIDSGSTGYICAIQNLAKPVEEWEVTGCNLLTMMTVEKRHGKEKPVIQKALVDLKGKPFKEFEKARIQWAIQDDYRYPGPIQYFGPRDLSEAVTITLAIRN